MSKETKTTENVAESQLMRLVSGTWVDAQKQKPTEEVILLTSSKIQVIGDWYRGVWRTPESYFEGKELKSIYKEEDIIAWTPKPEISEKYH